jgi:O-acetylhomoserine (thiol)-lyase
MDKNDYNFETICVHGNYNPKDFNNSRAVPLYQSAAFVYDSIDHAADLFSFDKEGHIYMRLDNPTVKEAEDRIAMLEKGIGAVCFASGMAAITGFILNFIQSGDRILSSSCLYGGASGLFNDTLPKLGINTDFFNPLDDFEDLIKPETKLVWIETLSNPTLVVPDLSKISAICRKHNIPLAVDNTVSTPLLCTPKDYGADFIMHSCTKYMEGHGNILGGALVDCGSFTFDQKRYPMMFEEAPGGKSFTEKFGNKAFLTRLRGKVLMNTGGTMAPFHAYMLIHGLESFHVRMERHCQNAEKIVSYLASHEKISWVNYPGLESHPAYKNAEKYLKGYKGAMIAFGIKGGYESCKKFINNIKLLTHTTNIGDTKTLLIHPASTTHRNLSDAEKEKNGINKDMIRLSVGIENVNDLIREIDDTLKIL